MNRRFLIPLFAAAIASACSAGSAKTKEQPSAPAAIAVAAAAAVEQPIARFIRATGTLMAEEQADVAAETAGRVVSAPIERGTPVTLGAELIRL
jgi:multidrug efflux pump subunit AcrA (membrane-fusion protein)